VVQELQIGGTGSLSRRIVIGNVSPSSSAACPGDPAQQGMAVPDQRADRDEPDKRGHADVPGQISTKHAVGLAISTEEMTFACVAR
jgi:hypothetical protein